MGATFNDVPRLLENKLPDCVFNSLLGLDNTAKLVLKACPIIVDSQPSSSEIEAVTTVPAQPCETSETEIDSSPSAAQATTSTNEQVENSSMNGSTSNGDRATGAISSDHKSASHKSETQPGSSSVQATRPTKPLPRRSARIRQSVVHTQASHEAARSDSVGGRALECPVQKILDGISTAFYDKETKRWKNWPKKNKTGKGKVVAKYLNKVVDAARHFAAEARESKSNPPTEAEVAGKDWVFSAQFARTPLESTEPKRKPHILLMPREHMGENGLGSWADDVRAIGEVKRGPAFPLSKLKGVLSEYARLCFGHQRTRRFVLGFSLLNTKMRLWKFDRSGVLNSREFDVHENPLDFLRVILGLTTADDYYVGLDPSFTREGDKDWVMLNDKRYQIVKTIYIDSVVRGRGTVALVVKDEDGRYLVMKDQWVDRSRKTKEFEMLDKLKKEEVKKVSRIIDYQIVQFQVGDEVVCDSTENDRNTKELQEKVEMSGVETLDHYRLLISPYGDNLENFRSLMELVSVFKDYVEVIRDLYDAGILHRDISPGNLIIVEEKGEPVRKGYIIDFDRAIVISRGGSAEAERTGTLPFMAIDVLMNKNPPHKYHYDLESLFYVLLWICITQDGPKSKRRPPSEFNFKHSPLRFWCARHESDASLEQVGRNKYSSMMMVMFMQQVLPWLSAYFRPLENLIRSLRRILFQYPDTDDIESLPEDQKPISDRKDISRVFSKFMEVLEATLQSLPDERQPSAVFGEQITVQSGIDARPGCNVDPEADFAEPKITEVNELRPRERLPAEPRKTGAECEAGLLRTAVMSSANNDIGPRGVKRSHDEEQTTETAPPPSSSPSKRARCPMSDS